MSDVGSPQQVLLSQLPLKELSDVLKDIILLERDLTEQDTIGLFVLNVFINLNF